MTLTTSNYNVDVLQILDKNVSATEIIYSHCVVRDLGLLLKYICYIYHHTLRTFNEMSLSIDFLEYDKFLARILDAYATILFVLLVVFICPASF